MQSIASICINTINNHTNKVIILIHIFIYTYYILSELSFYDRTTCSIGHDWTWSNKPSDTKSNIWFSATTRDCSNQYLEHKQLVLRCSCPRWTMSSICIRPHWTTSLPPPCPLIKRPGDVWYGNDQSDRPRALLFNKGSTTCLVTSNNIYMNNSNRLMIIAQRSRFYFADRQLLYQSNRQGYKQPVARAANVPRFHQTISNQLDEDAYWALLICNSLQQSHLETWHVFCSSCIIVACLNQPCTVPAPKEF